MFFITSNYLYFYGDYPPISSHLLRFNDESIDKTINSIYLLKSHVFSAKTLAKNGKKFVNDRSSLPKNSRCASSILMVLRTLGYIDIVRSNSYGYVSNTGEKRVRHVRTVYKITKKLDETKKEDLKKVLFDISRRIKYGGNAEKRKKIRRRYKK